MKNKFKNTSLGTRLEVPEAWQLIPGKWVKGFRKRSKLPSEDLKQMLMKINAPLLMAYLPPVDAFISVSTFQLDAKPIEYLTELGGFSGIFEHILN